MASTEGTVITIQKVNVSRRNKGLPDTERIDLIILPKNRDKPCRYQVRKDMFRDICHITEKDKVEVFFFSELNEIERDGQVLRFDNNILEAIRKVS